MFENSRQVMRLNKKHTPIICASGDALFVLFFMEKLWFFWKNFRLSADLNFFGNTFAAKNPNPYAPMDWNIYLYLPLKNQPNVGKYAIHGASRYFFSKFLVEWAQDKFSLINWCLVIMGNLRVPTKMPLSLPKKGVKKPITRIWGLQRTSLMQLPLIALEVEQQKTAPKSHDRTGRRGSVVFPFLGKLLFSLVIYMLNLQGV